MTFRFVAIADSEILVRTEMSVARPRMTRACARPPLPTMKPRRRKRMIPRIVRMLGVKTAAERPQACVPASVASTCAGRNLVHDSGMFYCGGSPGQMAGSPRIRCRPLYRRHDERRWNRSRSRCSADWGARTPCVFPASFCHGIRSGWLITSQSGQSSLRGSSSLLKVDRSTN